MEKLKLVLDIAGNAYFVPESKLDLFEKSYLSDDISTTVENFKQYKAPAEDQKAIDKIRKVDIGITSYELSSLYEILKVNPDPLTSSLLNTQEAVDKLKEMLESMFIYKHNTSVFKRDTK